MCDNDEPRKQTEEQYFYDKRYPDSFIYWSMTVPGILNTTQAY